MVCQVTTGKCMGKMRLRGGSELQKCCVLAFVDDSSRSSFLPRSQNVSWSLLRSDTDSSSRAHVPCNCDAQLLALRRRVPPQHLETPERGPALRCPASTRLTFVICIGEWVQRLCRHAGMAVNCPGRLSAVNDIPDYLLPGRLRCVMLVP